MNLEYKIVLTVLGQRCNTYIFEDMQLIEEKYSDTDLALVNIGNEKRSGRAIAHSGPQRILQRSSCVGNKVFPWQPWKNEITERRWTD